VSDWSHDTISVSNVEPITPAAYSARYILNVFVPNQLSVQQTNSITLFENQFRLWNTPKSQEYSSVTLFVIPVAIVTHADIATTPQDIFIIVATMSFVVLTSIKQKYVSSTYFIDIAGVAPIDSVLSYITVPVRGSTNIILFAPDLNTIKHSTSPFASIPEAINQSQSASVV